MNPTQRQLELEVEVYRLKQRLALVSKFALAAEQELIILATSPPEDGGGQAGAQSEHRDDEAT